MAGIATATNEITQASYYYGLRSKLKLVATTLPLEEHPRDFLDTGYPAKKRFSIVGTHTINDLYQTSIQGGILSLLASVSWLSVLVVRVGYRGTQDDPLTVLVLAEFGTVGGERASQLVHEIKALHESWVRCHSNVYRASTKLSQSLRLMDVHVEICEAYPRSALDNDTQMLRSPYATPNGSPFAGGSIGANLTSAGSLGAILKISSSSSSSSPMSAGLIGHHVCFPPCRPHSTGMTKPSTDLPHALHTDVYHASDPSKNSASYKSDGSDPYLVTCPSMLDFSRSHQVLQSIITKATQHIDNLRVNIASNLTGSQQKQLRLEEQKLEGYLAEQSQLEDCNPITFAVFQTSGICTRNGWIVDWALASHEFEDVSEVNTVFQKPISSVSLTVVVFNSSNSAIQDSMTSASSSQFLDSLVVTSPTLCHRKFVKISACTTPQSYSSSTAVPPPGPSATC